MGIVFDMDGGPCDTGSSTKRNLHADLFCIVMVSQAIYENRLRLAFNSSLPTSGFLVSLPRPCCCYQLATVTLSRADGKPGENVELGSICKASSSPFFTSPLQEWRVLCDPSLCPLPSLRSLRQIEWLASSDWRPFQGPNPRQSGAGSS